MKGYTGIFIFIIINIVVALKSEQKINKTIVMANQPQIVHKLKYVTLKIAEVKEDIKFNKRCIQENVTPNYVQISTKATTIAARKTLQTARKIWVKEEINMQYSKLNELNKKADEIKNEINSQYHNESIEEFMEYITTWVNRIINKKRETHSKKLDKLIENQRQRQDINEDVDSPFYTKVKNLTNIEFNDEEIDLLGKSLKYNINLDFKSQEQEDELIDVEVAIKKMSKEIQDPLRNNFIHELNKTDLKIKNPNIKIKGQKEYNCVRTIGQKLSDKEAIITKADKSNTVVIIEKHDYETKVNKFINDNSFMMLNKDPTQEYNKNANTSISKCKTLSNTEKIKLKNINPKAPNLRGQPKLHKEGIPIRPVVNFMNAPTYKLCKFLNTKLNNKLNYTQDYSVKNSLDLISKIKDVNIPTNTMFISFDVSNMYTNIPTKETMEILKENLRKNNVPKNELDDISKLLKTTLNQNYFEFNSKYYKQNDGLAMGSPISGTLANLYMNHLETTKIMNAENPFFDKIIYWHRYVDDIICLFEGEENQCNELLQYLNSISQKIKFTIEIQKQEINFMDLTIYKNINKHEFKIFRKPSQTDLIINKNSNHPWQQKMSSFYSMVHRLINVPMSEKYYEEEKRTIKSLAIRNGYASNIVDKIIRKTKNKTLQNNEDNKKDFICMPHSSILNKAIRKTFQHTQFKVSYRTRNNAFHMIKKFSNKKTQQNTDQYTLPGIYKITCKDCPKYYIGQTGRNFKCRYKEHLQAIKSNNQTSQTSKFAEHILTTDHTYGKLEENLKILSIVKKGEKMNTKEEFFIYTNYTQDKDNILNIMQTQQQNPIFEKIQEIKYIQN
jgi:hypothetical protein